MVGRLPRLRSLVALAVVMLAGVLAPAASASPTPLAPANGASATTGVSVQFTASDTQSPYLQISSSPQTNADGTLKNPDLESDTLMEGTGGSDFGTTWTPDNVNAQTVYWVVYDFNCNTLTDRCGNDASPVQTLYVAGLPAPEPSAPRLGASVRVGNVVTFATNETDSNSLHVGVSSSPATNPDGTLANPNIDLLDLSYDGATYSADSFSAAEKVRTVYWVLYRDDCSGSGCSEEASPVQTLHVVPPPVSVRMSGPLRFRLKHPTISWTIRCNVACHGKTFARALVRAHGHDRLIPHLSIGSKSFTLTAARKPRFSVSYTGKSLRLLRATLITYGRVRWVVHVSAVDAAGHTSSAHRTLYMLPPPRPPAHKPTSAPAPTPSCFPTTSSGGCYEPGEYCRTSDHGAHGVAGDGKSIVCKDNNGWRWEPA